MNAEQVQIVSAHVFRNYKPENPLPAHRLASEEIKRYLLEYWTKPHDIVRSQNKFIRKLPEHNRLEFINAALDLVFQIEKQAHIETKNLPSLETHQETRGKDYLLHGDILPGTRFKLGQRDTYERELLEVKKDSKNTRQFTEQARELAASDKTEQEIARELFDSVGKRTRQKRQQPTPGTIEGIGTIMLTKENVCRHKAAQLVLCLQEAGIKAGYVRGTFGVSPHAWVDAQLDGKSFLIDPEMGVFNTPQEIETNVAKLGMQFPRHVAEKGINVIWRRKRKY